MQTADSKAVSPGRPFGKANLSEAVKLEIVKEKKLQQISQIEIAQKYGIARRTVNVLSENNLSDESKAQLQTFTQKLAKARDKTLERIQEKLDADAFKPSDYSPLFNTLNQSHRLETGQSTVNVSVKSYAELFVKWLAITNADQPTIDTKLQAIADANGLNLAELRAAVFGQTQE